MGIGRLVSGLIEAGPAGRAVRQERGRQARLLRHPLGADRHAAARAGVRRLAGRGGQGGDAAAETQARAQLPTTSGEVNRRRAASTLSAVMRPGARVLLATGCSRWSWSGRRSPT